MTANMRLAFRLVYNEQHYTPLANRCECLGTEMKVADHRNLTHAIAVPNDSQ